MKRALLVALIDWVVTLAVGAVGYHAVAVDWIWIVLVAVLAGTSARIFVDRTLERRDVEREELAQLIAMGAGYGVDHVPGESTENFRQRVVVERDERAKHERRKWLEKEGVRS